MSTNQDGQAKLDTQYRTMLILWLAFLSMFAMYYFLPVMIGSSQGSENRLLMIVLRAVSILLVAGSFLVKRQFLSRSIAAQDARLVNTGFILAAALCEAGALLGLIDSLVARDRYYFVLIGIAMIGLVLHFPKRVHLEAASFKRIDAPSR